MIKGRQYSFLCQQGLILKDIVCPSAQHFFAKSNPVGYGIQC